MAREFGPSKEYLSFLVDQQREADHLVRATRTELGRRHYVALPDSLDDKHLRQIMESTEGMPSFVDIITYPLVAAAKILNHLPHKET